MLPIGRVMATEIYMRKLYDTLAPVDQASLDSLCELLPNGEYKCVITKPRNLPFLKKFFALVNVAYEGWNPDPVFHKGVEIKKNKDVFRKNLTVMAGFYDTVFNINGELRLEPKSISFANMDDEEFSRLYSKFIDVVLGKVLTNYTKDDLDEQVNKILGFV